MLLLRLRLRNSSGNVIHADGSTLFQAGFCPAHGDKLIKVIPMKNVVNFVVRNKLCVMVLLFQVLSILSRGGVEIGLLMFVFPLIAIANRVDTLTAERRKSGQ